MRKKQEAVRESMNDHHGHDSVREKHPAYGMIGIGRRSNSESNLFGSALKHKHTISIIISKAEKHQTPYKDLYFGKKEIVEVELSANQWAECLMSMNYGSGVPCTIRHIDGELMPECPEIDQKSRLNDDVKQKFSRFSDTLRDKELKINEILNQPKNIGKGQRKEISNIMSQFFTELNNNLPFLHQCMQSAVDDTISQAKGEIESHALTTMMKLGMDNSQDTISEIELPNVKLVEYDSE